MGFNTESIRNIALIGHGGTGKTSLLEHMLFAAGAIPKPETVESGKTTSDYTDEEIDRTLSIHTVLAHMNKNDTKINALDTPGSADFVGEVVAALRAAESAVVLVDAKSGVQIETLKLWRRLSDRNMPRIAFINQMDAERASFETALADLREKFDATFVPVVVPAGAGPDFRGVVDVITQKFYPVPEANKTEKAADVPEDMKDAVEEHRQAMIESAAEGDDELLEKYFEAGELSDEEILRGLQEGLRANKFVPVLCGVATAGSGAAALLEFIQAAAPSPAGVVEECFVGDGDEEGTRTISEDGSFSALVWKTSIDQFSGRLSFVKAVTGKLTGDSEVYCPQAQAKQRISKVYSAVGKKLDDISELAAGDIGVLTKLDGVDTNDSLCAADDVVRYKALRLPQPVHGVAISAKAKKDEDKLNQMLHRAAEQDLTFRVEHNQETKETVISGMGELHLNMILDRIKENQKIEVDTKMPKVAYRETITKPSGAEYTHKKQTGGHGQYARVVLEIEPVDRGEYFRFVNAIHGGSISKGYIPGVEKGILEGMEGGILAGYPVVDLEARVVDGKEHPVDSSEMAFKVASRGALRTAMEKANPVLLEPVMNLTVFVDEQYLGDVLSDLSSRRGRVMGQEPVGGGVQEIKAQVPQAELLRYSVELRSITSGTASFEVEFSHYEQISGRIAEDVINAAKREAEAVAG
jgi:elongation factor G